jgi:antitoxin (DNA-binding transcriptional repressor) of toxin-antitoxin stability system
MHTVGIRTLKNKLCEYQRLAAKGETVLVTDRDRAVAEMVAPRVPADATTAEVKVGERVGRD